MSLRVPESLRLEEISSPRDGNNGAFALRGVSHRDDLFIVASDGGGWEHVSVSKKYECPTWEEMCQIKKLFWPDPEDCVIQYHPPKSEHVNVHPYCLHLWRPIGAKFPVPPTYMVGPVEATS